MALTSITSRLITPDFVEVKDSKIEAYSDHPQIPSLALDSYDEIVLPLLVGLLLTPAQKAAMDAALTQFASTNPVVLKDDIPTYNPGANLGELKDTVATFAALPLLGNTVGDVRSVLDVGNLYRWDGAAWVIFINAGTLDHTILINKNAELAYQHVTSTEKQSLLSGSHTHANQAVLDLITSAGSGVILTTNERGRIPSADEKDALAGTFGFPNFFNRYATHTDPRMNTLKNPYVTVGPLGSGATFEGTDIVLFATAIAAVTTGGMADEVKAIEVLPGLYDLTTGAPAPMTWGEAEELMIEAMPPGAATIKGATLQHILDLVGPGTTSVTVKGIVWDLNDVGTGGIQVDRDNVLIEDCTFVSGAGAVPGDLLKGVTVRGANCVIRRCSFLDELADGGIIITSTATGTRIEDCQFALTDPSYDTIRVESSADDVRISYCHFYLGTITVEALASNVQFSQNFLAASVTFSDVGVNTRILSSQQPAAAQPFTNSTKTIGPLGSYADYEGSDELTFAAAMSDPFASTFIVLPGAYSFASAVTIPQGMGVSGSLGVVFSGSSGIFTLSNHSRVESVAFATTGTAALILPAITGAVIQNCLFDFQSPASGSDYIVQSSGAGQETHVKGCQFTGVRGIHLTGGTAEHIEDCLFSTGSGPLVITSGTNSRVRGNSFLSVNPTLAGNRLVVEGNHFLLGVVISGTIDSVWQHNYPPVTNNTSGVVSFEGCFEPAGVGVSRGEIQSLGALVFFEAANGLAATSQTDLKFEINQAVGFTVRARWTGNYTSGNTKWRCTTVFRVPGTLGTTATLTVVSPRTALSPLEEDSVDFVFSALDYGGIVDPTTVSVTLTRLGLDAGDTFPGDAYVTEVVALFGV